jgi:accessory gene regulator protein AgrB
MALNKQKSLFASTLDLNLRKKLVKCYIWSIVLYGAATWILRKVDQNTWKVLKCGAGEVWRRSYGPIV